MSASYRVRQFVRAVGARFQPRDAGEIRLYLPPAALDLFWAMSGYDQQHALDVLCTLQGEGYTNPDLLAAALLHDVGKTVGQAGTLRLWHRVAAVLMRRFWPGVLERIGVAQPGSWRHPFFVQQNHAAIGAELARTAGCSPRTVELIRRHEDPMDQVDDPLLAVLKAADSLN